MRLARCLSSEVDGFANPGARGRSVVSDQSWRDVAAIGMNASINDSMVTKLRSSNDTTCFWRAGHFPVSRILHRDRVAGEGVPGELPKLAACGDERGLHR